MTQTGILSMTLNSLPGDSLRPEAEPSRELTQIDQHGQALGVFRDALKESWQYSKTDQFKKDWSIFHNGEFNPVAFKKWAKLFTVGTLVTLLVASCGAFINHGGGGTGNSDPGPTNNPGANVCDNLVAIAAQAHVDVAANSLGWVSAQTGDHTALETDFNCFAPNGSHLIVAGTMEGDIPDLTDDVVLTTLSRPGKELTPLLAVPVLEVDVDRDGKIDYQLFKYLDPKATMNWAKMGRGHYEMPLNEVNLDARGDLEKGNTALLKAEKDSQTGKWVFTLQVFDDGDSSGRIVALSEDQVNLNDHTRKWLEQVKVLDTDSDNAKTPVYGHDISTGADGYKYGFSGPDDLIIAALYGQRWKPVIDPDGNLVGSMDEEAGVCAIIPPNNLVTGSFVGKSQDGIITYYFPGGGADQVLRWHDLPVPEGWLCVAVVAQEGNTFGPDGSAVPAGTVGLRYFRGNGKGGFDIHPGFISLMWDASNTGVFERTATGVRKTVTTPTGATFVEELNFMEAHYDLPAGSILAQTQEKIGQNFVVRPDGSVFGIDLRISNEGYARYTYEGYLYTFLPDAIVRVNDYKFRAGFMEFTVDQNTGRITSEFMMVSAPEGGVDTSANYPLLVINADSGPGDPAYDSILAYLEQVAKQNNEADIFNHMTFTDGRPFDMGVSEWTAWKTKSYLMYRPISSYGGDAFYINRLTAWPQQLFEKGYAMLTIVDKTSGVKTSAFIMPFITHDVSDDFVQIAIINGSIPFASDKIETWQRFKEWRTHWMSPPYLLFLLQPQDFLSLGGDQVLANFIYRAQHQVANVEYLDASYPSLPRAWRQALFAIGVYMGGNGAE